MMDGLKTQRDKTKEDFSQYKERFDNVKEKITGNLSQYKEKTKSSFDSYIASQVGTYNDRRQEMKLALGDVSYVDPDKIGASADAVKNISNELYAHLPITLYDRFDVNPIFDELSKVRTYGDDVVKDGYHFGFDGPKNTHNMFFQEATA